MNISDRYDDWTDDATQRIAEFLGEILYAGCSYTSTKQFQGVVQEWLEDAVRLVDPALYTVLSADYELCDWEQILERFPDSRSEKR